MARLTTAQALEKLNSPKNGGQLVEARNHEQRLVMHTEPITSTAYFPQNALREFQQKVKALLPEDKYKRFIQLLPTPLDTIESTKSIFDELSKVFNTQDGFKKVDFVTSELAEDFNEYLNKIEDNNFWPTKGFDALKNQICSLIVVDMPAVQKTLRPEPYYYILNTELIIDVDYNGYSGRVEYVAFSQKEKKAVVICDEFYRTFQKLDGGEWTLLNESPHTTYTEGGEVSDGLGYCPVEPFYKKNIAGSNGVNKRAPITDVLGKLDWLLFWRTSVKYFELYAAWPPFVVYETECHYRDANGNACDNGFITYNSWDGEVNKKSSYQCPACAKKELIGPGTVFTVPTPRNNNDFNMLDGDGPVKSVDAPVETLQYVTNRIKELEDEIYLACVGYDGDSLNNKAVNETQVSANFESKEAVLDGIKNEFQRAQKFVIDTMAKLRYGNYFVKSIVDWGNEYFLHTVDTLTQQLKDARANGMPMYYIASLRDRVIQTSSKNNPDEQNRNEILAQLEPYPDLGLQNIALIKDDDPINYTIKLNFTTFIQQFERENGNIVTFGSLLDKDKKISIIKQKLEEYATATRSKAASARPDSGANGGPA